jgi:hypothetical protein
MIFLFSCATRQDFFQKVEVGQTKHAIRHVLGKPKKVKNFKKLAGPIFGPEEEFWDKIPDRTSLEALNYQSSAGSLNLYFLDGEDVLSYKAFIQRVLPIRCKLEKLI